MKKLLVSCLLLSIILTGCGELITFDKPQPENGRSLSAFPKRLRGQYSSPDNTSLIIITNELLVKEVELFEKYDKESIDSSYKLDGEFLVDLTNGQKEKVVVEQDSIIRRYHEVDTFRISDSNVLKKFKGYYFLSSRLDDDKWGVKKLSLKSGLLTISSIATEDDIKKLQEITVATNDTMSTHFSLTRSEFKRFVKEKGFEGKKVFIRIR